MQNRERIEEETRGQSLIWAIWISWASKGIGLISVFDAILTCRQSGQKLQCLYGNLMANNLFQN